MRTTHLRLAVFGSAVLGLGLALISVPKDAAAQKGPVMIDEPQPPTKEKDSFLNEKISFPENKETKKRLEAVNDYLAQKEIKWDQVCKLAQSILDDKSDYFYQYEDGDKRRVSVKEEVTKLIGKFTPEGLGFYQNVYGPVADTILKASKESGLDRSKLAEVAQRYFFTKSGTEAALLLAAINLDSGNYPEASYGYRRLLSRPDADKLFDAKNAFRAAVAIRRANNNVPTDEVASIWEKVEKKYPKDGIVFGRKGYTVDQLKAELERPVELLFGSVGSQYVSMKGGDTTRAAIAEAGVPFLGPILSVPVLYNTELPEQKAAAEKVMTWIDNAYRETKTNPRMKQTLIPSFFPITAPYVIIFRGYDGVYAFATRNYTTSFGIKKQEGELLWFTPSEYGAATIESLGSEGDSISADRSNQRTWLERWTSQLNSPGVLFENPLAGTLSHDGKRVFFVDDYNVPPSNVAYNPEFGGPMPAQTARSGKMEYNRLVAVDIESGMRQWTLGDTPSENSDADETQMGSAQLTAGAYFLGPPVTVNGKLYVLFEKDGSLKLGCFDAYRELPIQADPKRTTSTRLGGKSARQPDVIWVQNLGKANTAIKQDSDNRRTQGVFLAAAEGVMVCPTNTGAIVAVDLNARSLLWAHTYVVGEKKDEIGPGGGRPGRPWNPGGRPAAGATSNRWRSSGPIIVGGRVINTSFDSGLIECIDLRSGKLLWSEARKSDDLYVGGVVNSNVIIVGQTAIRALKLVGEKDERTGREKPVSAWEASAKIGTPIGHGVAGKDGIFYVPVIGDPEKREDTTASVVSIDTATGKYRGAPTVYRRKEGLTSTADPRLALGNLVFHDNMMFSQSATELIAFPLNEAKQKEVALRLADNPNDPDGLVSRGELVLEAGKLKEAIADFKKAEANKPSEGTLKKLKQKLYIAYTEQLKNDFAACEPILEEYRALCEFPVSKDDIDYNRQLDEQVRRRGLMYCLVAKGRESQSRLIDAFDAYRAYAELGEKGKLLPVPEDPSVQALSSVWASERIDAMMKKTTDAALRKPLEDRVAKEFEEIKAGNDLDRLRRFVKVFGPYFTTGREAQYLLADRLNATNSDENRREAQGMLLTLSGLAEDDKDASGAARAIESLARLLTARGLTDDSLGLYANLAAKYPTTVVRDGKTGSDLLDELITDKRYLPSLESGQAAPIGKYKAKINSGSSNSVRQPSTGLVRSGEAFPFFNRYRVSLDSDVNNPSSTSVRVEDRVSGEKKSTSANLGAIMYYQYSTQGIDPNYGMNNQRIAQVSGHLMMVQSFNTVTCFDLSKDIAKDGKLWSVNLYGAAAPVSNPNNPWYLQYTSERNGELYVTPFWYDNFGGGQQRYETPIRIGRTFVLQSNYATVMTKDGIVTRDPRTGTILWQRPPVSTQSLIFGDSRYVYVVDVQQNATTSRVFRAIDGVEVPNVQSFSSLIHNNAACLKFGGRRILMFDSAGKEKPKALRSYDIISGKDAWSKEYPAESVAFETLDDRIAAVLTPDGKIDVVDAKEGTVLKTLKLDANRVATQIKDEKGKFSVAKPLLMADGERYYAFLNRDKNAAQQQPESVMNIASPLPVKVVNGTAYGFDRTTGERLWYVEGEFANLRLLVERFEELPCLVAFNPAFTDDPNNRIGKGGIANGHKVVIVDKANGAFRDIGVLQNAQNQWLQSINYDSKTRSFELMTAGQGSVKISPEVDAKK